MKVSLALLLLFLPAWASAASYGLHAGGHFGYGKMGNETNDANQARNMGTFDLQALPGVRLYNQMLLVGLMLDYRFLSQLSDDSSLSPYGGHGYLTGPGFVLDLPVIKFLFSWDILARHYYSGPDTTYKGSGFHFLLGYKLTGNLAVDLEYVIARYNAVSINDTEIGIGDFAVKHKNLGFGLSWTY